MASSLLARLRDELVALFTTPLPWWLFPSEWWERAVIRWERRRGVLTVDDPRLELTVEDLELARNAAAAAAADPREPQRYREWYSVVADKLDRVKNALESDRG